MAMRWSRRRVLLVAVTGVLIAWAGWVFVVWLAVVIGLPFETTSVWTYRTVLKQWSETGLVKHFPVAVPAQAKNVRFSAEPGFLQGGAHIQLRMQLPAEEIASIQAKLQGATTRVYSGGGRHEHDVPTTTFHTGGLYEFPSHYR